MPTYVSLIKFTEKGIREVTDTVKRAEAFKKLAKKHGASVREILWTHGRYDLVSTIEAPDDATATALLLGVAKLGNVHSETLRAFTSTEMEKILERVG
jgi:uncharacterized protein with GYD domain